MLKDLMSKYNTSKEVKLQDKEEAITQAKEIKTKEHEVKIKKLDTQSKFAAEGKTPPEDLDRVAMDQMKNSYKDEILMAIFFTPVILAFYPDAQCAIKSGFLVLAGMPTWYMYLLAGITIVTFGMRGLFKVFMSKRIGKI